MIPQKYLSALLAEAHDILNVGGFKDEMKDEFEGRSYKTLDINPLAKPDIVGSAYEIPLPDKSLDAIISFSLLEHLETPERFIAEIKRTLRPRGQIYVTTPFIHPYHGGMNEGTYCPDYYRFTHDGLAYLFRDFDIEITSDGGFIYALGYFFPRFTGLFKKLDFLYPNGKSRHMYAVYGRLK
jgi:SAM-dependent methyltransferase